MSCLQLNKFSPKQIATFNSIRSEVALGGEATPLLRSICPTRWTVRNAVFHKIIAILSYCHTGGSQKRK